MQPFRNSRRWLGGFSTHLHHGSDMSSKSYGWHQTLPLNQDIYRVTEGVPALRPNLKFCNWAPIQLDSVDKLYMRNP